MRYAMTGAIAKLLFAVLLFAVPVMAATTPVAKVAIADHRTSVAFAGRMISFTAPDVQELRQMRMSAHDVLYVNTFDGSWYRVGTFGPCFEMDFIRDIVFIPGPTGKLDHSSFILVDGHRCPVSTVTAVPAPLVSKSP